MKIRKTQRVEINPHNTLQNGAYYFKGVVTRKAEDEDREGIFFDCAAGLIFLAFSLESVVNYIGSLKIEGWQERQAFAEKRKLVFNHLGLDPNDFQGALEAANALMRFRDTLAHGKPTVFEHVTEFEIANPDDAMLSVDLEPDWQKFASDEQFFRVYDLIKDLNKVMLEKSGIPLAEQLDGGSAHITMLSPTEPE